MDENGRFWPAEGDREPHNTVIYVRPAQGYRTNDDLVMYAKLDTPQEIERRLRENFPLYRLAAWGGRMLGLTGAMYEV